jgi:hypothetical protein
MQKSYMKTKQQNALMTLDELIATRLRDLVRPVPSKKTLGRWFRAARIPYYKANPSAPHGGGVRYFSVPGVERFFRRVATRRSRPAKAPTTKEATPRR